MYKPTMNDLTDAELLHRYQREGNVQAFDMLVVRYRGLVYATSRRWIEDPSDIEDVTQAVLLILYQKAPRLHGEQRLAAWLYKTCQLVARNHLRNRSVRQRRESRSMEETARQQEQDQEALWARIDADMNLALDNLSPPDRELVLLRFLMGLSVREVGDAMRISEGAAQMRLSRAVQRLRDWFVKQGVVLSVATLVTILEEKASEATSVAGADFSPTSSNTTALALAKGTLIQMRNILLVKVGLLAVVTLTGTVGIGRAVQTAFPAETVRLETRLSTGAMQSESQESPTLEQIIGEIEKSESRLRTFEATVQVSGNGVPGQTTRLAYAADNSYWGYKNVTQTTEQDGSGSTQLFDGSSTYLLATIRQRNGNITQQAEQFSGNDAIGRGAWQLNTLHFGVLSAQGFPISRHLRSGKYSVSGVIQNTQFGMVYVVTGEDSLVGPSSLDPKAGRTVPTNGIDTRFIKHRTFWIAPKYGWLSLQQKEGDTILNGERLPSNLDYRATELARYGDTWIPIAGVEEMNGSPLLTATAQSVRVNQTPQSRFTWSAPAGVTVQNNASR